MTSLKAVLPQIATVLRTTPDALYSRQRKLAQLGFLEIAPGRGPGSGTPISADAIGVLLVSMLCFDSPSEMNEDVLPLFAARSDVKMPRDRFGSLTFREAVGAALSGALTGKVLIHRINVTRLWRAEIALVTDRRKIHDIRFVTSGPSMVELESRPVPTKILQFEFNEFWKLKEALQNVSESW